MNNDKSIVVLNNLIKINNDRIQDYETATIVTEESDLKNLFSECKKTSVIFKRSSKNGWNCNGYN